MCGRGALEGRCHFAATQLGPYAARFTNHTQPLRPIIATADALLSALSQLAARRRTLSAPQDFGFASTPISAPRATRLCALQDGSDAPNQR